MIILDAIHTLKLLGEESPTLVIAPLRVARTTWKEECARWEHLSDLTVSTIVGTPNQRLEALRAKADIYTVNYENLQWLIKQCGKDWPFKTIVCDESTKLKGNRAHFKKSKLGKKFMVRTGGARTNALCQVAFEQTGRMWLLTGTPAPNGLRDLWGQQFFVDEGKALGSSFDAFSQRWFRVGSNGYGLKMLPYTEEQIREAMAPTTFVLRAEDYLDLGEEKVNTIYVDIPDSARKHYKEMEKELYTVIKAGEVEAFTMATKSMKCHQLANGALYFDKEGSWEEVHTEKLDALQSVIEEAAGMPVIVVYTFKSDLARLKKAFPKGKALDTDPKTEDNFKRGLIPILFLHPDSAGHGIDGFQNVTNIICFFSVDWNQETRSQVIGRIGKVRQYQAGFNRPVFIHQIIARDTIDEDILYRVEEKVSVEDALKKGLARRINER